MKITHRLSAVVENCLGSMQKHTERLISHEDLSGFWTVFCFGVVINCVGIALVFCSSEVYVAFILVGK